LCPKLIKILQSITGTTSYVSIVSSATDRDSTALVFSNLSNTISQIEYTVLGVIILMAILIVLLISLLVINDSKNLAAIMKALGYNDKKNLSSFLSVYFPVILLSVAISIPIAIGLVAAFNGIIFNGVGIFLTTSINILDIIAALGLTLPFFAIAAITGFGSLKREKLTERLKA
jgi:putative ABC transport system permease protein